VNLGIYFLEGGTIVSNGGGWLSRTVTGDAASKVTRLIFRTLQGCETTKMQRTSNIFDKI